MSYLKTAYQIGAALAQQHFAKTAELSSADIITGLSTAIPLPLTALISGAATSEEGKRFAGGAGATLGSAGGGLTGTLAGAGLGRLVGRPEAGALVGGMLGSGLGAMAGRRAATE